MTGGLLIALGGWLHAAARAQGGRGGMAARSGVWEREDKDEGSFPPSPVTG